MANRKKEYDSPFTGKIICGDCNGFYGHRVWHSNEPCRKNIWLCNNKYDGNTVCCPPKVTEEEIMAGFLNAVNECLSSITAMKAQLVAHY